MPAQQREQQRDRGTEGQNDRGSSRGTGSTTRADHLRSWAGREAETHLALTLARAGLALTLARAGAGAGGSSAIGSGANARGTIRVSRRGGGRRWTRPRT